MKIPIHLITGFLGSGKTTCIDQLLKYFDEKYRIGIVQNEFAPANVDGMELRNKGRSFEILEINNGSVFCICLLEDFTRALATFIGEKKPDLVLIEASGLSDPSSVIEILQKPQVKDLVYLKEIWCIVDAFHFLKMEKMMNRIHRQLMISDRIIINKTDLVSFDLVSQIRDRIKKINRVADIVETRFCNINTTFLARDTEFIPLAGKIRNELDKIEQFRPDLNVGVFKSGRKIRFEELKKLIRDYSGQTIRMKGNVLLKNGKTALVQAVFKKIRLNITDKMYGNTCLIIMGDHFNLSEFSRDFRAKTDF
jgi:G3E family GTPase